MGEKSKVLDPDIGIPIFMIRRPWDRCIYTYIYNGNSYTW